MERENHSAILGILAICFIGGAAAGCLCSVWGGESADMAVSDYLANITQGSVVRPDLFSAVINQLQYPIICFFLGLTILGVFLIPVCFAARGFFLAFAATSCLRVFGTSSGLLLAGAMLAPGALVSVPCMFLLGTGGGASSLALFMSTVPKGQRPVSFPVVSKPILLRLGLCLIILTAGAIAETFACPWLLQAVLPQIAAIT
ncbi:MAG: stage II sporulation protein M [Oscillospiraceae bacterium]|nr:stage II sporulation protein M [Oscillospiraceae bacterium]